MTVHELDFRVSYADTDRMGVVYYANYLILFERGRTELMREAKVRYRDLEEEGLFLPAMEANLRYLSPAHYDDLLKIKTRICDLGRASMTFAYEVVNADTGKTLVRGTTKHPFVNKSWKPVAVPPRLRELLVPLVRPSV